MEYPPHCLPELGIRGCLAATKTFIVPCSYAEEICIQAAHQDLSEARRVRKSSQVSAVAALAAHV